MRNTKAFKEAVGDTLAALARRGVTVRLGVVEDVIKRNMSAVPERMGVQARSAWRYVGADALAESMTRQRKQFEDGHNADEAGQAPMPPVGNPELAVVLAGVPDALAEGGGDLYQVIVNVAVNAWMAGHIHGEDGCAGCEGSRGPMGHDWNARMKAILDLQPDVTRWFDRDHWTAALHDVGFTVTRR